MAKNIWQKVLRVFYEYSAELVLYIEEGKVKGVISKPDIEYAMSDIEYTRSEINTIPVRQVNDLELLIELHQKFAVNAYEKTGVLPVVNKKKDFVGLWSRTELIQAHQPISEVKTWSPPKVSKKIDDLNDEKTEDAKPSIGVEIDKCDEQLLVAEIERQASLDKDPREFEDTNTQAEQSEPEPEPTQENQPEPVEVNIQQPKKTVTKVEEDTTPKWKAQIEHGVLAILTIETLPLPLLAADPNGKELFFNTDWRELNKAHLSALGTQYLIHFAKERMAQLALDGALDVKDTIELDVLPDNNIVKMRVIREDTKAIGYLFWVMQRAQKPEKVQAFGDIKVRALTKKDRVSIENEAKSSGFLGRTLPDIVSQEEKRAILWALEQSGGNRSNAAMLLGIPRQTFSYKMQKYFKKDH